MAAGGDPKAPEKRVVYHVPEEVPAGWRTAEAVDHQIAAAELLEYDVFVAEKYCDPNPQRRVLEYDPWRDRSSFMVVSDSEGRVRGSVRVMVGPYDELPVGLFPRYDPYPPDPVLEYASLAVPPDNRRTGVAEWLYREVWRHALRHSAQGLVGIGETWLLELLNRYYPFGFTRLGPSRWYMGGNCFPMGTAMIDLTERLVAQPSYLEWAVSTIDLREVDEPAGREAVIDLRSRIRTDG